MDEEESAIGKNGMMHGRSRGDFRVLGKSDERCTYVHASLPPPVER